jgi:hypothetical protein
MKRVLFTTFLRPRNFKKFNLKQLTLHQKQYFSISHFKFQHVVELNSENFETEIMSTVRCYFI